MIVPKDFGIQLYAIGYSNLIQIIYKYIWAKGGTLTKSTAMGHIGPGSNGNELSLHSSQISRSGASPPDALLCHTQDTTLFQGKGVLFLLGGYRQHILSPIDNNSNLYKDVLVYFYGVTCAMSKIVTTHIRNDTVSGYESLLQLNFSSSRRKERDKVKELLQPLRYTDRIKSGRLVLSPLIDHLGTWAVTRDRTWPHRGLSVRSGPFNCRLTVSSKIFY